MKIFWQKIPKCFTHAALLDDKETVWVFIGRPGLWEDTDTLGQWIPKTLDGTRRLIVGDEYELDGNEDWKTSLQERQKECSECHGTGEYESYVGDQMYFRDTCERCDGTGLEPEWGRA